MELTKEEWNLLFECLKWNKYNYEEKWATKSYRKIQPQSFKEDTLKQMDDLINKLHKIKDGIKTNTP